MSDTKDKASGSFDGNGNYLPPNAVNSPLLTRQITDEWSTDRGQAMKSTYDEHVAFMDGIKQARDFYEAKIASGELMVVKTATIYREDVCWFCSECNAGTFDSVQSSPVAGSFCTHCGAKIIEG